MREMGIFNWFQKKSVESAYLDLHKIVTDRLITLGVDIKDLQDRIKKLEKDADKKPPIFQSGKSHLASDEVEDPDKYIESFTSYSPVADSIEFKGAYGIEYAVGLIEGSAKYKALLKAQHRMINRLYKLAATSVEDPGKSITEELRKAEKWKKILSRKFRELREG